MSRGLGDVPQWSFESVWASGAQCVPVDQQLYASFFESDSTSPPALLSSASAAAQPCGVARPAADLPAGAYEGPEQLRPRPNPREWAGGAPARSRFFIIKSYSEDDVHKSIKYAVWTSTESGNKRLDRAYRECSALGAKVVLFFSVNASGQFCGVAEMASAVDHGRRVECWQQEGKWKGAFSVRWVYIKDVPNSHLRHIRLENNEGKSVTNSRDTQEVPYAHGLEMAAIFAAFRHRTSIIDDFQFYERRQQEMMRDRLCSSASSTTTSSHQQPQQQQQPLQCTPYQQPQQQHGGGATETRVPLAQFIVEQPHYRARDARSPRHPH
eukprot:m51a1_g5868 hypothetical protein (325) ;mRNA; f:397876-399516